jgi:hypothetical protein
MRGITEMKRLFGHFLVDTTAILAALFVVSLSSGAQTRTPGAAANGAKKGAAAEAAPTPPRMANGHPDLSGVYFPGPQDPDNYQLGQTNGPNRKFAREFEKPSFQPWVSEKAKLMGDLERADPEIGCAPPGGPGFFYKGNYAIMG